MGKVAKTLQKIKESSKTMQQDLDHLKEIRQTSPSKTGQQLSAIQRRARIVKANMSQSVMILRQHFMKEIDKFIQDIDTNMDKLEKAHQNYDTSEMNDILNSITDMRSRVPNLTTNIEDAISYFKNKEDSAVGGEKSVNQSTATSHDESTNDGKSDNIPSTSTSTATSHDTQEIIFSDEDDEAEILTIQNNTQEEIAIENNTEEEITIENTTKAEAE